MPQGIILSIEEHNELLKHAELGKQLENGFKLEVGLLIDFLKYFTEYEMKGRTDKDTSNAIATSILIGYNTTSKLFRVKYDAVEGLKIYRK